MNKIAGITPENRGHRPKLSEEKTLTYLIKLPESLKKWCLKVGPNQVRAVIEDAKKLSDF